MRSVSQTRRPIGHTRTPTPTSSRNGSSSLQRRASAAPQTAALQRWQALANAASHAAPAAALQRVVDDVALQRQMEDEELMQGRFIEPLQRQIEEEEPLQGRFAEPLQRAESMPTGGLPGNLRSGIEALSGADMGDVRVHYASPEPATVAAHAYAQGNDIHVAPGQERHLPHEAWHVVQQRQGRVQPTTSVDGVAINDDPGLEQEADRMGARARRESARDIS
jgi:hypothetical protein